MNRFLYAEANPWTFSDPSGHATCYASADLCDEMMAIQHQGTQAARDASRRMRSRVNQDYSYARRLHEKSRRIDPPEATPETAWADQDTWGESTKIGLASAAGTAAQAAAPAKRTVICGGRSGCAPSDGGSDDAGTALVVASVVVVGALVCIFGGCEAAAAAIGGSAIVQGLAAAGSAACYYLCDKLRTLGAIANESVGGSPSAGGAAIKAAEVAGADAAGAAAGASVRFGPGRYGPYYRLESPTQTAETAGLQASSGEIWGKVSRGGLSPTVDAYKGRLPPDERGIEFYTDAVPNAGGAPGIERWSLPNPGVEAVDDATVKICAIIVSIRC